MTLSPQIVLQVMSDPSAVSGQAPIVVAPPTSPVVKLTGPLGDVMEGGQAQFAVNRSNNVVGDVRVDWTATSPAGDTAAATLTGTLPLASGYDIVTAVIPTVNRAGLQAEPRQIHIVLSNPVGAALDPAGSALDIPIRNRTATLPTWHNLPRRSNRAWAGGTANLPGTLAVDPNTALEQTVAYNDCGFGHSRGANNANVATWAQVIGGALGGPMLETDTQFQWTEASSFGLHFLRMPNSSGWLLWDMSLIPTDRATNAGDGSVWAEISGGFRDAEMQAIGARIAQKFAAKGHSLERFIGCPHAGMNNGRYFQVFQNTANAYKLAMERAIAQIRLGANYPTLRFAHCPSQYLWIGNLASWTPNNVDAIGLDYDVQSDVVSDVELANLLDSTGYSLHYGLRTDLIDVSDRMNLPIVVYNWIVQNAATLGCPWSYQALVRFYDDFLQPNAARIVCECLSSTVILNAGGYQGPPGIGDHVWVHVRFVNGTKPTNYDAQVGALQSQFQLIGLTATIVSEQNVTLASSFDSMAGGDVLDTPSAEHTALYNAAKGSITQYEILCCFVQTTTLADGTTVTKGFSCSTLPCAVVSLNNTDYTMAHEVAHCLGLAHVTDTNNLMLNNTANITNLPPDLTAEQGTQANASTLVSQSAAESWAAASAAFKTKWLGTNAGSVVVYNPPTMSIAAVAASVQEG